ncbi:MAG TPA: alanine racemase [Gemmatimonadales bacterium]|nr:alanine racemase [Gemmatimonadales bacterium]
MRIDDLPTPALLLDLDRLEANISRMADRARTLGVRLRPHVKTHKCLEIAERQRAAGAVGITVSTLYEGRVFADAGAEDVTWAFPFVASRLQEARELAGRTRLGVVVDSAAAAELLIGSGHPWDVWLKVDCGYHRAGVDPGDPDAVRLARTLHNARSLTFRGILSHSGHAYHGRSRQEIADAAAEEHRIMTGFAAALRAAGVPVAEVSVGSTPAMSVVRDLTGIQEARPGNYVFYDYTQVRLGSCAPTDVALTVLSSVVSASRTHSVIDAGALALSKDRGPVHLGVDTMGEIIADYDQGRLRPDYRVVSVSQEHGIVNARLDVASRVRIMPNHSCLTAAQFDQYHVVRGDRAVDCWKIWRGR